MVVYDRHRWQEQCRFKERLRKAVGWSLFLDLALFVVLQPYRPVLVVGQSMFPTLQNLQFVIAKPLDGEVKRGEVVVAVDSDEAVVKRIGGVEGDTDLPGLPRPFRVPRNHV